MSKNEKDYTRVIFNMNDTDSDMVDITTGKSGKSSDDEYEYKDGFVMPVVKNRKEKKNKKQKASHKEKSSKKKTAIIISSVAAAVVIALGITGFCIFGGFGSNDEPDAEFTFAEDTVVSGISISGKTLSQAKELLDSKKESFIKPIKIDIDVNGKVCTVTEKDFSYTYDIDEVLGNIKAVSESSSAKSSDTVYTITATATRESLDKVVDNIAEDNNTDAVDARVSKFHPYSKNRFEYEEAVDGCSVNTTDLEDKIKGVLASGESSYSIKADVESIKADVQVDNLKKDIVKLASYETTSYNTANGTSNMKVSLEACNGSIIEPGATWSFNKCTGDSNLESNGYKPAAVIVDGKHDIGIGGGICQSSSTIYNAAVRANMEVVERYNHKWASTYVPTGLDATIDYDRLDLKLKNISKYQMFLECKLVDSKLYVSFWGWQSPDYDEIKTANLLTSRGSSSYTVKAWRVYFKDGKEVDRESLGSSTYDSSSGYFIDAEYDIGDADADVDNIVETTKPSSKPQSSSKPESSTATKPQSSATSKPESSATSKPEHSDAETTPETTPPPQETENNAENPDD